VLTGVFLGGGPEGKRPLGTCRPIWEYNIKIDLQKVARRSMDWSDLAQNREGGGFHKMQGIS